MQQLFVPSPLDPSVLDNQERPAYTPLAQVAPQQPVEGTGPSFSWLPRIFRPRTTLADASPSTDFTLISPYVAGAFAHPELIDDFGYRREAFLKPENTANPATKDRLLVNPNKLPHPSLWTQ